MEKIEPGKYVELIYDLYKVDTDGEQLVHQSDPEDPEKIVFGVTPGVIPALEKTLAGLQSGDKFTVTVPPAEAFGMPDPEQIVELDRDIFVVDGKFDSEMIKVGAFVPMMTADGFRINGKVTSVGAEKVTMDFNHPLAGCEVKFDGTVKTIREATPEELKPAHGCGGGCNCGDHSCGDGCGGCGGGCN